MTPLSFAQHRLWFLNAIEGPNERYNVAFLQHLSGSLDIAALQSALHDVVERHEVLRTVYPEVEGDPVQQVLPVSACQGLLRQVEVPADSRDEAVDRASRHAFDLATEIPLRVTVFSSGPHHHSLLLLMHHIATDGWSMAPLLRDLVSAYTARLAGRAPDWKPLPVQYADYTLWQRDLLGAEEDPDSLLHRQLDYWRGQLAGLPEEITLPTHRPRPAERTQLGAEHAFLIPAALHRRLEVVARQSRATAFMVLQAALAALLTRLGAGTDIPLGTVIAARTDEALDELVGFFANTLVLRTDTSGDPTFRELLDRVRDSDLDAYAHQELPFERLVEDLNPARSANRHPLFQVMLAFQNNAEEPIDLPGLVAVPGKVAGGSPKFDLTLYVDDMRGPAGEPAGLDAVWGYATDMFDTATVEVLSERLVRLLEAIASDPDARVHHADILSPAERRKILADWSGEAVDLPALCLADLFEAQAARTPGATALVFADTTLTYTELDSRAGALARILTSRGAGPDRRVALVLERSVDLVVALLATVKSGAAYVPIDPDYPAERIADMLVDSSPVLVLATSTTSGAAATAQAELLLLDSATPPAAREEVADDRPGARPSPDDLAYVIFTSGSTGRPKGVGVPHRAIVNRLAWMHHAYGLTPADRVLQKTPFGFDVSVWEFFWPLLHGATLVLARPQGHRDPAYLADLIQREHITVTHFVPSMLQEFLREPGAARCGHLRLVLASGEALPVAVRDRALSVLAGVPLHNLYGPTEAAVDVTSWHCTPGDGGTSVPIGRPVWNTRLRVLDARLQPVPVGTPGELYLAGVQLARGYLGRPGLTAERFVADPFGTAGDLMYRTGDLVRRRSDGALDFLGRADDQVKLRGFRIELGDIEAHLAAHPSVAQAAVVLREDRPGEQQLVGYVVPAQPGLDPAALRRALARSLPAHMVPTAVVPLDAFPLTANGKLDRKLLPRLDRTAATGTRTPRNPREEILATLFAEVLGLGSVGVDADFFELGGHSLLATRLVSRIRHTLGVELDLRDLFESPTATGLAARLDDTRRTRPPLTRRSRPPVVPLSYAQQRLWFLGQLEGSSPTYNMPLAHRLSGDLDRAALEAALGDVVDRHESLRTTYPGTADGRPQQVTDTAARPVLTLVECGEEELPEALSTAAWQGFDLNSDLPVRAWLFALGPHEHVLLLVVHHIVADGWSMAPLMRDVALAYAARAAGHAPAWEPLPVQYADYALWQREMFGADGDPTGLLADQSAFWRDELAEMPHQLDLPYDRSRSAAADRTGGRIPFTVAPEVRERLARLARETRSTMFMVLQACVTVLLSRSGAGQDIPLATAVAGRTDEALDNLVGFFVNTVVLRTDTSGDPTFRELVDRARAANLRAYAHQDLPFELLVEALNPERVPGANPLAQVMLTLENNAEAPLDLPALRVSPERVEGSGSAKFDLFFWFSQSLEGGIEYAPVFDASTVEALISRLLRLLEACAADPDARIGSIDLLSGAERRQLLVDWNDTALPVPDATLVGLFEAQVARTPAAPALAFGDSVVSYGELNARADRLARELTDTGAGPETFVAIAMERSEWMVVALLAVLKSGAAYVPVDPGHPAERIGFILQDAAVGLLLTDGSLPQEVVREGTTVLLVPSSPDPAAGRHQSAAAPARAAQADAAPARVPRPENPAYVLYTSGSTGRPKGTVVQHASLTNFIQAMRVVFPLTPADRLLAVTTIAFDIAALELFLPLVSGAQVVIAPSATVRDPEALAELLRHGGVTALQATPSLWQELLADGEPGSTGFPSGLRVGVGGEPLPSHLAERLLRLGEVTNLYGPTETTIWSTSASLRASDAPTAAESAQPPIGRPIANTQVYVLDARLSPVPAGVIGELYLAGAGLARGYLNRPALTADRFVADPFGAVGTRMYRTGDVVRWNRSGHLEFVGRADDQVKLRGFRIEPGEIESVLVGHPDVARAAVMVREYRPGDQRLVAYVVPADAREAAVREADQEAGAGARDQRLAEWRQVYEDRYTLMDAPVFEESFDAWTSSYEGSALPVDEMLEWRETTVRRIMSLNPRRVLELGVGNGLLLSQLIDACEEYWATDFSGLAVERLAGVLAGDRTRSSKAHLLTQAAHRFDNLPEGYFDTVVINSVVQYFPDIDYLLAVLRGAVAALAPGGVVFVGDVRDLRLATCLGFAAAGGDADSKEGAEDAMRAAERRLFLEEELLVDPAFFSAIGDELGPLGAVEVHLKRGRYQNELSRYRYDVLLQRSPSGSVPVTGLDALVWGRDIAEVDRLREELDTGTRDGLRVTGIPNQRIAADWARFTAARRAATAAPAAGADEADASAVDPEDLYSLADGLGWKAVMTVPGGGRPDAFDAVFLRPSTGADTEAPAPLLGLSAPLRPEVRRRLSAYVNSPGARRSSQHLRESLRQLAAERLPDYMVPSAVVVVDSFPLTPNGKLDRRLLPVPDSIGTPEGRGPRTQREEILCGLFSETLGLERVSIDDGFFALGGHSLLATRLVSRIRAALGTELTIRDLFESPTIAELAARLDGTGRARPRLRATDRPARVPMSFEQRRLWFLSELDGGVAYNIPFAQRLSGPLDTAALEAALADVTARHEVLRTVFPSTDGLQWQEVLEGPAGQPELQTTRCDEEALTALLTAAAERPFRLTHEMPLRAQLFRIDEEDHVLLLVLHHIACDGWSLGPLLGDLGRAYRARLNGRDPGWPPLDLQYADYTLWQKELLGDAEDPRSVVAEQLAFWRDSLAGIPAQLRLPFDRPRSAEGDLRAGVVGFEIEPQLLARLATVARAEGSTLFMALQAAVAVVLSRLGAGTDIALGTATSGRSEDELYGLVGFFAKTLVLRNDLSGDPSYAELLARVRDVDLAAFDRQDVPFESLVEAVNPERVVGANPLFQVSVSMQIDDEPELDLPGLRGERQRVGTGLAAFDLSFQFEEAAEPAGGTASDPRRLEGLLRYRSALFDRTTAESVVTRLVRVIGTVAADPHRRISDLEILSDAEHRRIVADWNDTGQDVPAGTIPELFAAQVARTPSAPALDFGEVRLTYTELDSRTSRLAQELVARGVGPEQFVALALPRSELMAVALLAVLKTGAAYLPIDPGYPAERISFLLDDAAPVCLLSTQETAARLPGGSGVPVLLLDDEAFAASCRSRPSVVPAGRYEGARALPTHPAYVIHTSGSTGVPKGVVVTHTGVASMVASQVAELGVGAGSRVLQFASLSFDASVWETWMALLTGGCMVVASEGDRVAGPGLTALLRSKRITHATLPPTVILSTEFDPDVAGTTLVTAGEVCTPAVVAAAAGFGRLVNAYGPTEATVCATMHRPDPATTAVPIGGPLLNTRVFVLDEHLRPVPEKVTGELYIAGPGLARGYLNRPGTTAERFVANPFGAPGERMYRTGDLVTWTDAGELVFVGRADQQVKIRGFRIEPDEVASVVADHPQVSQCVVVREERAGEPALIAYAVPARPGAHGGPPLDAAEVRRYSTTRLPEYMVPATVVVLDALPLTSNGKVDRRALPAPASTRPAPMSGSGTALPADPRTRTLARIFASVLGVDEVGPDESFFELGGHSLLGVRLTNRIRSLLGAEIGIRTLFEAPTAALLATRLDDAPTDQFASVIELQRGDPAGTPVFCIHPIGGLAWCYTAILPYLRRDQPVHGIQVTESQGRFRPVASMAELVTRYTDLIRATHPDGPYVLLGWSLGGVLAHEVAGRLQAEGARVDLVVLFDSRPYQDSIAEESSGDSFAQWVTGEVLNSGGPDGVFDERQTRTLVRAARSVASVLGRSTPNAYAGSALCVSASDTVERLGRAADAWRPFLPQADHVTVDATHSTVLSAKAMAQSGPHLSAALSREPRRPGTADAPGTEEQS